jgi:hypothetical protein
VDALAPHSPARGLVPMRSLKAGQVMVGLLCSEKVIAAESGDREVL